MSFRSYLGSRNLGETWQMRSEILRQMASEILGDPNVAGFANAILQPPDGNFEIHVEMNNQRWSVMPRLLSDGLLWLWRSGENNVAYVCGAADWDGTRPETYGRMPYNRYTIDFTTMQQRNSDRSRVREIKIVRVVKAE